MFCVGLGMQVHKKIWGPMSNSTIKSRFLTISKKLKSKQTMTSMLPQKLHTVPMPQKEHKSDSKIFGVVTNPRRFQTSLVYQLTIAS